MSMCNGLNNLMRQSCYFPFFKDRELRFRDVPISEIMQLVTDDQEALWCISIVKRSILFVVDNLSIPWYLQSFYHLTEFVCLDSLQTVGLDLSITQYLMAPALSGILLIEQLLCLGCYV